MTLLLDRYKLCRSWRPSIYVVHVFQRYYVRILWFYAARGPHQRPLPTVSSEFRSEPQKLRFLRNAVVGVEWADQAVSQCTTAEYTFSKFATSLREALQLHWRSCAALVVRRELMSLKTTLIL